MASVDYMEKLTDDIFITFSTLLLFSPNKTRRIMDAKSQLCISCSTQNSTGRAFIYTYHQLDVFALAVKVQARVAWL